jgi:hypothetical protein
VQAEGKRAVNDYVALLIVIAIVIGPWALLRLRIWRRCRCGTYFCISCGSRRGR